VLPDFTQFNALLNPLGITIVILGIVSFGVVPALRYRDFGTWLGDRVAPVSIVVGCFFIGAVVAGGSGFVVDYFHLWRGEKGAVIEPSISAADLLVNLLTISALTASAAFAYLCLPTDRMEMRLSSITRTVLLELLIELKQFDDWYDQAPSAEKMTPACKLINGLLSPRLAVGGWYTLSSSDFDTRTWRKLSKFVDSHLDDSWVRVSLFGLLVGMLMGFICLFFRYFGLHDFVFHPVEFGIVMSLLLLNVGIGSLLVSLAFGAHSGELDLRNEIKTSVQNLAPHISEYMTARRNFELEEVAAKARDLTAKRSEERAQEERGARPRRR
jgi:hypothetical protein